MLVQVSRFYLNRTWHQKRLEEIDSCDAAKLQNLTKEHDTQEFQVLWIMRRHSRSRFLISFPMSFCLPNRILGIVKRLEIQVFPSLLLYINLVVNYLFDDVHHSPSGGRGFVQSVHFLTMEEKYCQHFLWYHQKTK